jgi:hypothetical protein
MKKFFVLFMAFSVLCVSCSKELRRDTSKEDGPQLEIEMGGADNASVISTVESNEHDVYSFGGVRGTYYGCKSIFRTGGPSAIEIRLGTGLTANTILSDSDFVQLIQPGPREYGSLGSFTSFPQLLPNKVEIAFTDKDSKRWCTTHITEKSNDGDVETSIQFDQPEGVFVVDKIHKIEIGPEKEGYKVWGHFDCYLHEVNGESKMKIKGKFQGIVACED